MFIQLFLWPENNFWQFVMYRKIWLVCNSLDPFGISLKNYWSFHLQNSQRLAVTCACFQSIDNNPEVSHCSYLNSFRIRGWWPLDPAICLSFLCNLFWCSALRDNTFLELPVVPAQYQKLIKGFVQSFRIFFLCGFYSPEHFVFILIICWPYSGTVPVPKTVFRLYALL